MRACEGLTDALLYVIQSALGSSDIDSKVRCRHLDEASREWGAQGLSSAEHTYPGLLVRTRLLVPAHNQRYLTPDWQ